MTERMDALETTGDTGACDNPASSSGHKNQPEDHGGRKLLYGT